MNVDGFPTTSGSCLVEPRTAPTIDPPPEQGKLEQGMTIFFLLGARRYVERVGMPD
jgi:hypothetical protein